MMIDCAIIGGGPAGLNAALVLGRAKRRVIVFDDNRPRNAVTQESHGFLTRDGIKPAAFRTIAQQEISQYPSVEIRQMRVTDVQSQADSFALATDDQETFQAKTVLLATGLKETFPAVPGIENYYGKSLFSCPYCDGWERKDKPLVVISEGGQTFDYTKMIWNWSHDLVLCTNGHHPLTEEQRAILSKKQIKTVEAPITRLVGQDGYLEAIEFANQEPINRVGGFVVTTLSQASPFSTRLGCDKHDFGGTIVDPLGRTTVQGVYLAGEAVGHPSNLIIAASEGSKAAVAVNKDLIETEFQ